MGGPNEFLAVLPEMVTFVRVAEYGSFSAAAAVLDMTPSAASRHVTKLEKALGVQLMRRTTRQLRLTEPGLEAFEHCRAIVDSAQGTMQVAQKYMDVPHGQIKISCPKAFARHVLHPLILEFLQVQTNVDVHLTVTDPSIDPITEGMDLVVLVTKYPPQNLASRKLMRVEQILCAAQSFLDKHLPIEHPHDLIGVSCLYLGEKERDNRWMFRRGDETAEILVKGRYVANHSEIRLEAVVAGMGVGCVLDFVAREALAGGKIKRVLPDWELEANYHGTAQILYPQNRFLPPKCRILIDFLAEKLGMNTVRV